MKKQLHWLFWVLAFSGAMQWVGYGCHDVHAHQALLDYSEKHTTFLSSVALHWAGYDMHCYIVRNKSLFMT
jgi:hypothetical protein